MATNIPGARRVATKIPGARRAYRYLHRSAKAMGYRVGGADHPSECAVRKPQWEAVEFVRSHGCKSLAEIGCYLGHTTIEFARVLDGTGQIHVYDFDERVEDVTEKVRALGYTNITGFGNSHKRFDSYNWSLMRVLESNVQPIYDYVLLDGAHTWPLDALAFLLVDHLLVPEGFVQFDDCDWSLAESQTMNPSVFPPTRKNWTPEQIQAKQVRLIVDLLASRNAERWRPVDASGLSEDTRVFQKIG